jgi:2-oxoglutarate ferredoxin oxidoreductase subunit alpha
VSLELPLVVVDVQRGGPSTGLPTKTEQADLLQAMFGRNGEAPVPCIAPRSPADCFDAAIEAVRIATTYRTPVLLLSDGYLANGSEPWRIPDVAACPDLRVELRPPSRTRRRNDGPAFRPYDRDPDTLARPWAPPGTPGLEHRIGGIEKADGTGRSPTTPTTTTDGPAAPRRRSTPSTSRRSRSTTRTGTPSCCVDRLGLDLRPDRGRRRRRPPQGIAVATRTCAPQPVPRNTGEVCAATARCSCPR